MKSVLAELPNGESALRARAEALLEQIRVLKARQMGRQRPISPPRTNETNALDTTTATKDWVI
jgi:hypothetical protein